MADLETIGGIIGLPDHMLINQLESKTSDKVVKSYTVLVNPKSYGVSYKACYSQSDGMGSFGSTYLFNKVKADTMNIELLFDATGSLGKIPLLKTKSVLDQINDFLDVGFIPYEVEDADPKKLQIIWGDLQFEGVLETIDIDYSHFDHTGNPIRAKAQCAFSGGHVRFNNEPEAKPPKKNGKPRKFVDFAKQKHGINAIIKYSAYVPLLATQPKKGLPKSLRLADELLKLILK